MNDFKLQVARLRPEIDEAISRVLESGWFILGRELTAFEEEFARFVGVAHAVGVGNGMEAIELALRAAEIGPGDEVITTPNSAFATTLAIVRVGATPVFADIDARSYGLDPFEVARAITPRTRALLPVHIYGQSVDLDPLLELARSHGLFFLGDAAQAHGARYQDRDVATYGDATTYSFYPTKNLGAYGDAGMITTDDGERAARLRRLRDYGQSSRYHHVEPGLNSRLDEMQAAILRCKLRHLPGDNARRRAIANWYRDRLEKLPLIVPVERAWGTCVWHQFVVRTPRRDELMTHLGEHGVASLVHYPVIIPDQPALTGVPFRRGALPVAEKCAREFLSLPIYPEMTDSQVEEVTERIAEFFAGAGAKVEV